MFPSKNYRWLPHVFQFIFKNNSHLGLKTLYGKISQNIFQAQKERKYPDSLWNSLFLLTPLKKKPQTNSFIPSLKDFSFKKIFAWKGQVMFLNFNMLINCQIIISMELDLNSILIFNELPRINLIVMNTNTFNDDLLLIFKKCIINILIFWGLLLTISFCFICISAEKAPWGVFLTSPHWLWLLFGEAKNFHCGFKHGMILYFSLV